MHTTLARGGTRDLRAEGITGLIPQMNEKMAQELFKNNLWGLDRSHLVMVITNTDAICPTQYICKIKYIRVYKTLLVQNFVGWTMNTLLRAPIPIWKLPLLGLEATVLSKMKGLKEGLTKLHLQLPDVPSIELDGLQYHNQKAL